MEDKKSKRSRKKSKSTDDDYDEDFVDRQLRMAEKQMAKAMGQMKLAGKAARTAEHLEAEAEKMSSSPKSKGIVINSHGTQINIKSAENVQVGSHNTMVVMGNSGKSKKSSRRRKSYDSEEEEIIERAQQRREAEAAENDRHLQNILTSDRLVTSQDLDLASQHVGSDWRRFLRFLGLDDALLSQLHQDYYVEGIRQVVVQGLITWKRQADKQATLGTLTSTLKKVGYGDAVKLFKL